MSNGYQPPPVSGPAGFGRGMMETLPGILQMLMQMKQRRGELEGAKKEREQEEETRKREREQDIRLGRQREDVQYARETERERRKDIRDMFKTISELRGLDEGQVADLREAAVSTESLGQLPIPGPSMGRHPGFQLSAEQTYQKPQPGRFAGQMAQLPDPGAAIRSLEEKRLNLQIQNEQADMARKAEDVLGKEFRSTVMRRVEQLNSMNMSTGFSNYVQAYAETARAFAATEEGKYLQPEAIYKSMGTPAHMIGRLRAQYEPTAESAWPAAASKDILEYQEYGLPAEVVQDLMEELEKALPPPEPIDVTATEPRGLANLFAEGVGTLAMPGTSRGLTEARGQKAAALAQLERMQAPGYKGPGARSEGLGQLLGLGEVDRPLPGGLDAKLRELLRTLYPQGK